VTFWPLKKSGQIPVFVRHIPAGLDDTVSIRLIKKETCIINDLHVFIEAMPQILPEGI
jgi:hypothetical protein